MESCAYRSPDSIFYVCVPHYSRSSRPIADAMSIERRSIDADRARVYAVRQRAEGGMPGPAVPDNSDSDTRNVNVNVNVNVNGGCRRNQVNKSLLSARAGGGQTVLYAQGPGGSTKATTTLPTLLSSAITYLIFS